MIAGTKSKLQDRRAPRGMCWIPATTTVFCFRLVVPTSAPARTVRLALVRNAILLLIQNVSRNHCCALNTCDYSMTILSVLSLLFFRLSIVCCHSCANHHVPNPIIISVGNNVHNAHVQYTVPIPCQAMETVFCVNRMVGAIAFLVQLAKGLRALSSRMQSHAMAKVKRLKTAVADAMIQR